MREQVLEFYKGDLKFSSGHFTIFSPTEREHLHGHNFYLQAAIRVAVDDSGIAFDYRIFKRMLKTLCRQLHTYFLLPERSPYLSLKKEQDYIVATFNGKKIPFLHEDVVLLPISNVTLEELSQWFVSQVLESDVVKVHPIAALEIRVFNGLEQSALACWTRAVN